MSFREMVPGLDSIATQSIPYTRVVGRGKAAYVNTYRAWKDLAGETVENLLNLPGSAERTLERVIDLACEEVDAYQRAGARPSSLAAAVGELVDRLDARHRALLAGRHWSDEVVSNERIAQKLGVYAGWATRYYPTARSQFADLLSEPRYRQVSDMAISLRQEFGPYVPASLVTRRLTAAGLSIASLAAGVLLYAAGPYTRCGDWFENTALGGRETTVAALDQVFDGKLAKTLDELQEALAGAGVLPAIAPALLELLPLRLFDNVYVQVGPGPALDVLEDVLDEQTAPTVDELHAALVAGGIPSSVVRAVAAELLKLLPVRRFGDVYVRWGTTSTEQVAAVLRAYGRPMAPAEVVECIGDTAMTERTVRNAFTGKPIFVRTERAAWGLHSWGMREYRGLADELGHRIDTEGGVMSIDDLMAAMKRDFPEASEVSLDMYMQTLAFVIDDGLIRRRVDGDPWPTIRHWNTVAGVFRGTTGDLRVIRSVTSDVMRGTSQTIKRPVAGALGVTPGERKTFGTEAGELTVYWLLGTPGAPHLSSLLGVARSVGASAGDELVLTFKRTRATAERIPRGLSQQQRFRLVTGRPALNMATLAASLDSPPEKVVALLTKRGDDKLAAAARKLRR